LEVQSTVWHAPLPAHAIAAEAVIADPIGCPLYGGPGPIDLRRSSTPGKRAIDLRRPQRAPRLCRSPSIGDGQKRIAGERLAG
jgi:hypothetical protein